MIKINSRLKDRVGERHLTNENYWVTIIKYSNNKNCDVQFDNGVVIKGLCYLHIVKGSVVNPYHLSVYGVGYKGVGKYKSEIDGKPTKVYTTWNSMMERSYSKKLHKRQATYKDVVVCKEWHNFQVYGEWFENSFKEGFELDKDILIKGNKTYSPETCCFVPAEINTLFIKYGRTRGTLPIGVIRYSNRFQARIRKLGETISLEVRDTPEEAFEVYKKAKEEWIKIMADKWRGQITEPCYEAMYRYEVEITD